MAISKLQSTLDGPYNATDTSNFAFDCGSGSDITLVLVIMWGDGATAGEVQVDTCEYDGVSLTWRAESHWLPFGDNRYNTEIWTMDNPSSGSNTVNVVLNESIGNFDSLWVLALSQIGFPL